MMDKLTPDDFPLRAVGVLIYARSQSSPILTAFTPQLAEYIAALLNDYAAIKIKVERGGSLLVTPNNPNARIYPGNGYVIDAESLP